MKGLGIQALTISGLTQMAASQRSLDGALVHLPRHTLSLGQASI